MFLFHTHTPTNAHVVCKITNQPFRQTLRQVLGINFQPQGDNNTKEYKLNTSSLHIHIVKNK